jgi:hypothetical protein
MVGYYFVETFKWLAAICIAGAVCFGVYWVWKSGTLVEDDKQCQQIGYQVTLAGQNASMAVVAHDACMRQKGHT